MTAKVIAVPAGMVVAAMPLLAFWQLHSYYRLAFGPVEIGVFAVGLAILLLGIVAGGRTASGVASWSLDDRERLRRRSAAER